MTRPDRPIKPGQMEFLQEIVAARCPELTDRLRSVGLKGLASSERETLEDALTYEFTASGLGADDEPTARGLEIEQLVSIVVALDWE